MTASHLKDHESAIGEPRTLVYIVGATCALLSIAYGFLYSEPSSAVGLALTWLPLVSVALWLHRDARLLGVAYVKQWGMVFYLAWPLALPYYAVITRGRAGWLLAAELYCITFVATLGWAEGYLLRMLLNYVVG